MKPRILVCEVCPILDTAICGGCESDTCCPHYPLRLWLDGATPRERMAFRYPKRHGVRRP